MPRIVPVKDGFAIRGIAPPELKGRDDGVRRIFWTFVLDQALRVKDRELAKGLNKDGEPLRPPISAKTRKHRRSAMTPSGKGDPSAPPLMPGRALSRTRSLMTGKAFADRVEIYWRYDPFTYDSWAQILRYQRDRFPGRDVFGLSQQGLATVTSRSWAAFRSYLKGKTMAPTPPTMAHAPAVLPRVGTTEMRWAEPGIGARPHAAPQTTGGLPWEKWLAYLRRPAAPPADAGRRRPWNQLLRMLFGN